MSKDQTTSQWQPIHTAPPDDDIIVRGVDGVERLYRSGYVHCEPGDMFPVMPKEWRPK